MHLNIRVDEFRKLIEEYVNVIESLKFSWICLRWKFSVILLKKKNRPFSDILISDVLRRDLFRETHQEGHTTLFKETHPERHETI